MADLDERLETEASVWGTGGRGFESRRSDQNGQDLRWEIRPSGFPHALFWMRNFAYVAPGPDGGATPGHSLRVFVNGAEASKA
jgi:hypothetical protein